MSRPSPSPSIHSLRNGSRAGDPFSVNGIGSAAAPMNYTPTPRPTRGELLGALVGTSLTVVNDDIYTFAGFDQYTDEVYNSLHKLTYSDYNECNWERVIYTRGRLPAKRNDHSATLWGKDKLVIFGGSSEEDEKYHNDIAILDLTTMTWEHPTTFGNRPEGRIRHSATIHNNKLYISGGILASSATTVTRTKGMSGQGHHPDTLLVLDLTTWIWQDPVPFVRRTQHITFVYHNRLYLFGGLQEDMTRSNYLSFIDINNNHNNNHHGTTSTSTPSSTEGLVTHLDIHSPLAPSLTAQRFLQIFGDQLVIVVTPSISQLSSGTNVTSGVWTLSLESLQWKCRQTGSNLGSCHWHSFAMAEHGTRLYLFGTEEELPDEYYSKMICLDLMELGIIRNPEPQLGADLGRLLDSTSLIKPDFTLQSGLGGEDGGELYVHRLVLLARWQYFYKRVLEMNDHLVDTLTLEQPLDTLRGFVYYLYNDQLDADDGDEEFSLMVVCDLLVMAFEYSMDRLLTLCVRRLYTGINVNNACQIFHAAKQSRQYGLGHHSLRYIFEHFGAVSHSDGFRHLPRDLFLQILDEMPKDAAIVAHGLLSSSAAGNFLNGSMIMQRGRSNGGGVNTDFGLQRQRRRQQRRGMAVDDDDDEEDEELDDVDEDIDIDSGSEDDDDDDDDDDDAMET